MKEILFSEEDKLKIKNYYINDKKSCISIAKIFKCSKQRILKELSGIIRNKEEVDKLRRKYSYNENIFEKIDSHETAYWIGMLAADGCNIKGTVKIHLHKKDILTIEKFKKFLSYSGEIKCVKSKSKNTEAHGFAIYSKKMSNDLKKYNVFGNKTFNFKINNIPYLYLNSFILGMIDGDGSFYLGRNNKAIRFGFIGTDKCVSQIKNIFMKIAKTSDVKIEKRLNGVSVLQYGGYKNIFKIYNYIYANDSGFSMRRKKDLVYTFFKNKNII